MEKGAAMSSQHHEDRLDREDTLPHIMKFNPPVSQQRYQTMVNLVQKYQAKKVLDMGCGECSLLRLLKRKECIEQLTGVDQDGDLLQSSRYLAKPLLCEYLIPRSKPFTVSLYEGSIGEKDARMLGYDLVLCVEIIEHLYPDTLAAIPDVVFGYMQPRVVVFTTPNTDFNVLFPDFTGFRHWDHKFEWSREEFQCWCDKVAKDFSYSVSYDGIGPGPPGTEHLGCCTQMAVFTCLLPPQEGSTHSDDRNPYNLICEVNHPHQTETMTTEEQILTEATYYLQRLSRSLRLSEAEEEDAPTEDGSDVLETEKDADEKREFSISLETMMKFSCLRRVCPSVEKLREVLSSMEAVTFSPDGSSVIYSIQEEDSSDSDFAAEDENDSDEPQTVEETSLHQDARVSWQQEESWD
ncbi:small RNA 2'-O-methyltransferase-like [Asterias amurensis]|uniref:small RNA 2'-O-methyltransferase-like n=1 Tax=Asterias amurensis TaxID=7602 RepID=UPI003AB5940D